MESTKDLSTTDDFLDFSDAYYKIIKSNVTNLTEEDLLWTLNFAKSLMIDFAKYHVGLALKEASEKAETQHISSGVYIVDKESILNSYDLNKIK